MTNYIEEIERELAAIVDVNIEPPIIQIPQSQIPDDLVDSNRLYTRTNVASKIKEDLLHLGYDENSNHKKLNDTQLKDVRNFGKFSVNSVTFSGKEHTWQLGLLLQKGLHNIKYSFLNSLATSVCRIIISIPERIYSDKYSISYAVKSFFNFFLTICEIFLGFTSYYEKSFFNEDVHVRKILKENLFVEENNKTYIRNGEDRIEYVDVQSLIMSKEKEIREYNNAWTNTTTARRNKLCKDIESETTNDVKTQEEINDGIEKMENDMYIEGFERMIKGNYSENEALIIISYFKCIDIYNRTIDDFYVGRENDKNKFIESMRLNNPFLSRSQIWKDNLNRKFNSYDYDYDETFNKSRIEIYTDICQKLPPSQHSVIFSEYIRILNSNELKMEKDKVRKENITETLFKCIIWDRNKWEIKNTGNEYYTTYSVNKHYTLKNSHSYVGWKLVNILLRIYAGFINFNYGLTKTMYRGTFGVRSLYCDTFFYTDWDVDNSGQLKQINENITMFGRMFLLCKNISESMDKFDSTASNGIIPKSIIRPLVWLWNYVIKGLTGLVLTIFLHPIFCLINIVVCLTLIVMSPILVVIYSILCYIFSILLLNTNIGRKYIYFPLLSAVIDKLLLKSLGNFVFAIGMILCDLLRSISSLIYNVITTSLRYVYDTVLYYLIIKPFGRIPMSDSILVRRVSGPCFDNDYYNLIDYKIALYFLYRQLETIEINAYSESLKENAKKSCTDLLTFYSKFKQVGLSQDLTFPKTQSINANYAKFLVTVDKEIREYLTKKDKIGLESRRNIYNFKMMRSDLDKYTKIASRLLKKFFSNDESVQDVVIANNYILNEMSNQTRKQKFWNSKSLLEGDWENLATYYLNQMFGNGIGTVAEDIDDTYFKLEIDQTRVSDFLNSLFSGQPIEMLDNTSTVIRYTNNNGIPKRNAMFSENYVNPKFVIEKDKQKINSNSFVDFNQSLVDFNQC